jgi:thiamine-phosphate pyrophosphorylase
MEKIVERHGRGLYEVKGEGAPVDAGIVRVLDVNLNRAREGLRVLEDTARLVWEEPGLFKKLRGFRHRLDKITRAAYPRLVSARESAGDMGRKIPETRRRSWEGLVAANFRRCQEALRVLEEYGKVFSPQASSDFKHLRFQLYTIEKSCLPSFRKK